MVSVLYAANLVGRLLASRLAHRMPVAVVLRSALLAALIGVPVLLFASSAIVAAAGLAITGIGIGARDSGVS